jgi:pimeloyl-ACP methyl ester carboxylesterase
MWASQLRALPDGWTALAPDFRGFGASTPDDEDAARADARIEDYADDVVAMLNEVGVSSAALCGCSMGGYVAFALLRRAPARVAGLLLADTRAAADTDAASASRAAMLDTLDRDGPAAIAAEMRPKLVGPTTRSRRPDVLAAVDTLMDRATARGVGFAVARMRNRPDATADLAAYRGPVSIVVGDEDTLTPQTEAAAMAALVPAAALVAIPGAGHLSNLESPEAFNAALHDWLRAIDGVAVGQPNPQSRIPSSEC